MNRIFKVIWSKAKNCYIVASELAKNRTKAPKSNVISHALAVSVLTAIFSFGALQSVYAATIADYPAGFTSRIGDNWSVTSLPDSTLITDWNVSGGDIAFRVQDAQVYVVIDGKFYQNEGRYRVLDESDRAFAGGTTYGTYSLAMGSGAIVSSDTSIAIGRQAQIASSSNDSIAIGDVAKADASDTVALGQLAHTTKHGAVAVGVVANAFGKDSVAIGEASTANEDNTVSFGHLSTDLDWQNKAYGSNLTRRLINVSDGIDDTDVSTVGQMHSYTTPTDNGNYVAGFSAS